MALRTLIPGQRLHNREISFILIYSHTHHFAHPCCLSAILRQPEQHLSDYFRILLPDYCE